MTDLAAVFAPDRLVELTQPLGPATGLWPGSRPFAATVVVDYDRDGGYAREIDVPEHAGTHLDAPAHFVRNGARVDQIPIEALVRPAVKLDVRTLIDDNPDATVDAAAIRALERQDGRIEPGTAVLVHTGWDAHWRDAERYVGINGPSFPGLTRDAAALLVERGVVGLGIDTPGVDPGFSEDFAVHLTTLPAGMWHLEGLVDLERVPPRGAWLIAAPLFLVDGSGAPARVFAVLPDGA